MLMPSSGVRLAWDAMSMLLVMFIACTLPFRVAFLMDWCATHIVPVPADCPLIVREILPLQYHHLCRFASVGPLPMSFAITRFLFCPQSTP